MGEYVHVRRVASNPLGGIDECFVVGETLQELHESEAKLAGVVQQCYEVVVGAEVENGLV